MLFARPIIYGSMRNILILKYWARKAKYHNISQYLADHVSKEEVVAKQLLMVNLSQLVMVGSCCYAITIIGAWS